MRTWHENEQIILVPAPRFYAQLTQTQIQTYIFAASIPRWRALTKARALDDI